MFCWITFLKQLNTVLLHYILATFPLAPCMRLTKSSLGLSKGARTKDSAVFQHYIKWTFQTSGEKSFGNSDSHNYMYRNHGGAAFSTYNFASPARILSILGWHCHLTLILHIVLNSLYPDVIVWLEIHWRRGWCEDRQEFVVNGLWRTEQAQMSQKYNNSHGKKRVIRKPFWGVCSCEGQRLGWVWGQMGRGVIVSAYSLPVDTDMLLLGMDCYCGQIWLETGICLSPDLASK